MEIKSKPLKHQRQFLKLADNNERFRFGNILLADDQGLGKTFESLMWAAKHDTFPCVIVCLASLKYNWAQEIKTHLGCRSVVLEGRTTTKCSTTTLRSAKFIIVNFQILQAWLPKLRKIRPQLVILDECQQISNRESQSYKNFVRLKERCKYMMALSGTPLSNRPAEIWPVLNLLRPDKWGSWWRFAIRHCNPKKVAGRMEYKGARNLPQLHKKMKKYCMIRRLKQDVLDLPSKAREVVVVPIDQNSAYRKSEASFRQKISTSSILSILQGKKALMGAQFATWRRLVGEAKIRSVIDWTKNFLSTTDEKLVVMFSHTRPIECMMEEFKDIAVRVDGKVTDKKVRAQAVRRFQRDKTCRLFVGNSRAAGVGLTLTAARILVMAELGWTPAEIRQVEDRVHRISQDHPVTIIYLVAKGSVEEKVARIVATKDNVLNEVLDGGGQERWQVHRLLKKK